MPSAFVFLEALPLTRNGKVDRRALAALPLERGGASAGTAPRTPAEELLAGIFAEVLGLERVGVEDRLLRAGRPLAAGDAGGLAGARRASGWSCRCGRCSRRRRWRRWPAGSSARAGRQDGDTRRRRSAILGAAGAAGALVRAGSGSGSSISSSRAARCTTSRRRSRLAGELDRAALCRARSARSCGGTRCCARRSGRRRASRCRSSPQPPDRPAGRRSRGRCPRRRAEGEAARLAGARRRARPFDLGRGPLLRAALVRARRAGARGALLTMHHIVSDGWSIGVLVRELGALYAAFRRGRLEPAAGAGDPVRRLRRLAAPVAVGRAPGVGARLLAASSSRGRRRRWSCRRTGRARRCASAAGSEP